jgi:acetyl/propionyl-CoA carboxylase alpha subunit
MISKLVVWANDRQTATGKSVAALNDYTIHGIKTNIAYLRQMLRHKAFVENKISTKFCDEHTEDILMQIEEGENKIDKNEFLFAFAVYSLKSNTLGYVKNVWEEIGYWRNKMLLEFEMSEQKTKLELKSEKNDFFTFSEGGGEFVVQLKSVSVNEIDIVYNNKLIKAFISEDEKGISSVSVNGYTIGIERTDIINNKKVYSSSEGDSSGGNLFSPMPGKVIKVNVKEGDEVKRGTILLVVEAMKMENNIVSVADAVVETVNVKEGDMVTSDFKLIDLTTI